MDWLKPTKKKVVLALIFFAIIQAIDMFSGLILVMMAENGGGYAVQTDLTGMVGAKGVTGLVGGQTGSLLPLIFLFEIIGSYIMSIISFVWIKEDE